jgi:Flp pilus assembly protein TadD
VKSGAGRALQCGASVARFAVIGLPLLTAGCIQDGGFQTTVVDNKDAVNEKAASLIRIADSTRAKGDNATAATLYAKVLEEYPNVTSARTSLAQTLLDSGDGSGALTYFEEAEKLEPDAVSIKLGMAQAYMVQNQPERAIVKFRAVLAKEPKNTEALNGLGVALDVLKKHAEAQKNYLAALKIDPGYKSARNNYGLSLALSGQHEKAVAEMMPLAQEEGLVGRKARQNIAMSFAMRGDLVSAAKWSRTDLEPEDIRNNLRIYGSIRQE